MTGTSSAFHITQVEEIKRIVGEAMYEKQIIGPDGSPMSGDVVVADFAALLALPTPADGATAIVIAPVIGGLAYGGVPRTRWVYIAGDGWRLGGDQTLLCDTTIVVGAANTTEQVLKSYEVPASLLLRLRWMDARVSAYKSGTADTLSLRGRLANVLIQGTITAAGTSRQTGIGAGIFPGSSPTSIRVENNASLITGGQSFPPPVSYTVPDLRSDRTLEYTCQMTSGTETPQIQYVRFIGA